MPTFRRNLLALSAVATKEYGVRSQKTILVIFTVMKTPDLYTLLWSHAAKEVTERIISRINKVLSKQFVYHDIKKIVRRFEPTPV